MPSKRSSLRSTKRRAPKRPTRTKARLQASPPPSPSPSNDPVFFWKPHQAHGYLGQWYPSPFTVGGETFATAEMWMMVHKARLFGDERIAARMLATTDPSEHRALGRDVGGFEERVWNEHKMRIVTDGNMLKFTVSAEAERLRAMLLATGERELVEASPRDRVWGVGFGAERAARERARWGRNLLGVVLMDVRARLRAGEGVDEGKKECGVDGGD